MTELTDAIRANNNGADNIIDIQRLVRETNNINEHEGPDEADTWENTALHLTTNPVVARILLDAGANIREPNANGNTPLHEAESASIAHILLTYSTYDAIEEDDFITNLDDPSYNQTTRNAVHIHATRLRNKLTQLTTIPDDVTQLSPEQKNLVLKLTAPKKAGNVLLARQELDGKNLINYLGENKPNLLLFAEGYHKDKIFGGVNPQKTDIASLTKAFNLLRPYASQIPSTPRTRVDTNETLRRIPGSNGVPSVISNPDQHFAKQAGIGLKKTHAATTIQHALRNHRPQLAQRPDNNPRPQQRRRLW